MRQLKKMSTRCYARRRLSPFQGTLQVITIGEGDAESIDGLNWVLYVKSEKIVSHTGLSEVRFGSWHPEKGLQRSMIRGSTQNHMIEQVGEALVREVEAHHDKVPFDMIDYWECWLLSEEDQRPLALLASKIHEPNDIEKHYSWHPGPAALTEFISEKGKIQRLIDQVANAAGKSSQGVWLERLSDGNGKAPDGRYWQADAFPELLISDHWARSDDQALLADFIKWQAPWLLQLMLKKDQMRSRLEEAADQRPREVDKVFRLFPKVCDREWLRIARVKAKLLSEKKKVQAEPFLPVYLE